MRRLEILLVLLSLLTAASRPTGQAPHDQLDPRIGPPVRTKYEAIQDAKDWLNPYLIVCCDAVQVVALERRSIVPISSVRVALLKLPLEAWPYGRVVAVQDCSITSTGDNDREERSARVIAVLRALRLQVERWPG